MHSEARDIVMARMMLLAAIEMSPQEVEAMVDARIKTLQQEARLHTRFNKAH
jgi:hypothetical protein